MSDLYICQYKDHCGSGGDACDCRHPHEWSEHCYKDTCLIINADVEEIQACYVTTEPCMHCIKLLLNTSCDRIYFKEKYDGRAIKLWQEQNRDIWWME